MRVLHVITDLATGGAEIMLSKLVSKMERSRFDSVVVSMMDEGVFGADIVEAGVPLYTLGMRRGVPSPSALWRLAAIVRVVKPDLVQGWMYHGNLAASFAKLSGLRRVPLLWNIRHTAYDLSSEKWLTAAVIRLGARLSHVPAKIIYNAHVSAAQHEAMGYAPTKTEMIPNGFDCERFAPSQDAREKLRAELGLSKDVLLIGLVARYHPMKGHTTFLRAAAILVARRRGVRFILVGRGVNADNAELRGLLRELGLESQVYLLGERHDIPVLTAALDVASNSSWSEAFPNVIGEAMACAVPCTVTDVGDSSWIVGDTGKTVPPDDPEALAEAWRELIDMGPEARNWLGLTARRRIEEQFALPAIVTRYSELYEEVTSRVRPGRFH